MSTRSKSKNAHATRRRSPPRELSASEIESLSTQSLRLHLDRLNLVATGKRSQLVARLKAPTGRSQMPPPARRRTEDRLPARRRGTNRPPARLRATNRPPARMGVTTPPPNHRGKTPPATSWMTGSGTTFPTWSRPANAGGPAMPLSRSLTVGHACGHRATDADTKKGIAVARKVAALTARIPPIPPAGTVATTVHPAPPVAARRIALFATADAGTVVTTIHHPVPAVLPAPVVIQAVVDITNTDITATDRTNRTEPWSAVHSPSHATLDGG